MRIRFACLFSFVLISVSFYAQPAHATSIDPMTWEQFAADAAFIGIVECETAGGIVARYRVVESWKGTPVGTIFSISIAVNYWEPQFPISLVGERYLIAAFKSQAPSRIVSTTLGNPVPLWWRNISADYSLPLFQGRVLLPLRTGEDPLYPLGSDHRDLNSFKAAVQKFLSLTTKQQEVRLLHRLSEKYLFFPEPPAEQDKLPAHYDTSKKSVMGSQSAEEIVRHLLTFAKKSPRDWGYSIAAVLQQAGKETTLKLLEATEPKQAPFEERLYVDTISGIRNRLGRPIAKPRDDERVDINRDPTEEELREMRKTLASNPTAEQFYQVFDTMTRHDPEPIADYLVRWKNNEKDWRDVDFGYVLGSYFAYRCGKDREANLRRLLQSDDPYIRVAGAVYLYFENKGEGAARLKELTNLAGDAGVWAALNLARRGDKSSIPRVLEVFADAGQTNMAGVPHENLQKRVLVLLSNSAHKSRIAQPSFSMDEREYENESERKSKQQRIYQYYVAWWESNKDKVIIDDPWLGILEQQKVD